MAKKPGINIFEKWLELKDLPLPPDVSINEIEEIMSVYPLAISLDVILPSGAEAPDFNFNKNADIKKFQKTLETKVVEGFKSIVELWKKDKSGDEAAAKKASSELKKLNDLINEAGTNLRVVTRTAVAKEVGGKLRADDLQTVGSSKAKEYRIIPGAFLNEVSFETGLLDLDKALTRVKKHQFVAIAWKGKECVVSVDLNKEFKEADLKELKEQLPEGFSAGAKTLAGVFIANSKTKVEFQFPSGGRLPPGKLLRKAMKKQSGQQTHVTVSQYESDDAGEEGTESKGSPMKGTKKVVAKISSKIKKVISKGSKKNSKKGQATETKKGSSSKRGQASE